PFAPANSLFENATFALAPMFTASPVAPDTRTALSCTAAMLATATVPPFTSTPRTTAMSPAATEIPVRCTSSGLLPSRLTPPGSAAAPYVPGASEMHVPDVAVAVADWSWASVVTWITVAHVTPLVHSAASQSGSSGTPAQAPATTWSAGHVGDVVE